MLKHLIWLAIGAFAIGTESFVIAGVLPAIAVDLSVSVPAAGQLVTAFALTYALGSPILATLTAKADRRRLLAASLGGFALANLLAALAQDYPQLMAARMLLALMAGLFMPVANSVAVTLAPPEKRGRAIAVVTGGMTIAVALGVPIGTLVSEFGHWRMTFVLIAAMASAGVIGLLIGLPRDLPRTVATMAERLAVMRRPAVLVALSVTTITIAGAFSVYTFISPLLTTTAGIAAEHVGLVLFLFGVASAIGNNLGGRATDRFGANRTLRLCLAVLTVVFAVMSVVAWTLPVGVVGPVTIAGIAIWGLFGWAFYPAQVARLVQLAPEVAVVVLSLNASALYLGCAAGAALGSLVLASNSPAELGLVAALCSIAALSLVRRRGALTGRPAADPAVAAE